jgi:hypothetical protein
MLSMPRIVRPDPHRIRGTEFGSPVGPATRRSIKRNKELAKSSDWRTRQSSEPLLPAHVERFIGDEEAAGLRFHFETSKRDRGGRRYLPYAFTEQGVAMPSSVLRSSRAVQVNIAIMRTFVRLREMLLSNTELARKLAALEDKYDAQFKVVFDAIRELMLPPSPLKRQIGFHVREAATRGYRVRRRK